MAIARCAKCKEVLFEGSELNPDQVPTCQQCGSQGLLISGVKRSVAVATDSSVVHHQVATGGMGLGGSFTAWVVGAPSILIQAVVELGDKTREGAFIEAVAAPWFEIAKLIKQDPSVIYKIDARKWEELIAGWYKAYGFDDVTLTPRSGDGGRDVIAVKRGILSVRILDQVKAYSPEHLVPANDVRALLGVLGSDRAATKGLVTTTSDFAPKIAEDAGIAPYLPTRLELVNGAELVRRLSEFARK